MMELRPIIVDEHNTVLGGNMRLAALKELSYNEIPKNWIKKASDLSQDEQKRFIIADNIGFGEWDWDILAEWDREQPIGAGIGNKKLRQICDNWLTIRGIRKI